MGFPLARHESAFQLGDEFERLLSRPLQRSREARHAQEVYVF